MKAVLGVLTMFLFLLAFSCREVRVMETETVIVPATEVEWYWVEVMREMKLEYFAFGVKDSVIIVASPSAPGFFVGYRYSQMIDYLLEYNEYVSQYLMYPRRGGQ